MTAARMLCAVDLDGTLIGESLIIDPVDAAAIAAASAAGCVVCLASGRLFAASRPFAQALGLRGPIIALQGGAAYDLATGQRLFCTTLPGDVARAAYDDLKSQDFHLQLYFGDRLYLDAMNDRARFYLRLSRVEPIMVEDLRRLLTDAVPSDPGPIKVLGISEPAFVAQTIPRLAQTLGDRALVFKSMPMFLEVTHPDANKGYALRRIAELLDIPVSRTGAVGDSDNDVPMLRAAGRSFAVANATEAAKKAAGEIVPALGSGGVAAALQLFQREVACEPA